MTDFNVLAINQNDPDAPQRFVRSLHKTGFAVLEGHTINVDDIEQMYAQWESFFSGDDKLNHAAQPGEMHGYYGFRSENAKGAKHKDLKEFYHVYQDKPVPVALEEKTRKFHADLLSIADVLLSWLDQNAPQHVSSSLSEPLTQMVSGSMQNLLRILHYPPTPEDIQQGEVRAAEHEDINLITLLVAGSEPGLQAKDQQGNWHDVPCKKGYITINAGDMLAKASGGYFPSTPHRVINPQKQENKSRFSMPLFVHPRPEVQLDEQQTAGDYLAERLKEIGLA